ncbi:DUF975 family protein [Clostridium sp. BL-8]|uniref:DUF975 family protein n=1 Tax=Clostridium sp. BL-8 TaxID=349938 RepID=UPI00098CB180|nr:DUF975 family protein [Clostridium sp. BL-8]OOM80911.1 hypothetical protein CLOBL_05100 [Clostridium sp. BL-8]
MNTASELKKQAKNQLRNRWGLAIGGCFISIIFFPAILAAINFFADTSSSLFIKAIVNIITLSINIILFMGALNLSLNYAKIENTPLLDDIFSGFSVFFKALIIYIIITICIAIGLILLIIPGIIIALIFSQSLYILMDDKSKSIIDCLKESANMMKGHKLEFFMLSVSFLGWIALIILPLFILILFPLPIYFLLVYILLLLIGLSLFLPYLNVTFAIFYLSVKRYYYDVREN